MNFISITINGDTLVCVTDLYLRRSQRKKETSGQEEGPSAQIEDPKGDQTKIKKSVTKKKEDKKEESLESSSDSSDSDSSVTTGSEVDSDCEETYQSGGATDDYEDSEENAGDISQDEEVEDVEGNDEDGQEGELDP